MSPGAVVVDVGSSGMVGESPLVVSLAWNRHAAVGEGSSWLTEAERAVLEALRVPKRIQDWRLGRWVAKEAVARALHAPDLPRPGVEILASPGGGPKAEVRVPGAWDPVTVSLSHAGGMGLAAAAVGHHRLGCDVEEVAPRSEDFVADYFTDDEALWILDDPRDKGLRANLLWSAKESALKALGEGLRRDTRSVHVTATLAPDHQPRGWGSLKVVSATGEAFAGVWRWALGFVWTLVAECPISVDGGPEA